MKRKFPKMLNKQPPHLKKNRNIILFQIHSSNPKTVCMSLPQSASLADLYQKVENTLFPYNYSSLEKINSGQSFYNFISKKRTPIHKIFATSTKKDNFITIPNSDKLNIIDFIDNKEEYFNDYSQLPQLHNLYRIYVLEQETYEMHKASEKNLSTTVYQNIQKFATCFS